MKLLLFRSSRFLAAARLAVPPVLLAFAFAFSPGALQADIKLAPGKKKDKDREKDDGKRMEQVTALSPEVKPAEVSFVAGRSVDVELDAAAVIVTGLRFLIRQQPEHGRLSNLRPHPEERHKAVVTYMHTGGDENLADSFTYACRIGEGAFSAPARVTLLGRRAEPKLTVLKQAMFGRVLPGTQAMAKLVVANHGIGPFKADMQWPSPWLGPPRLELDIGETAEVALLVTPDRPGVLTKEILLQEGNEASKVRLWLQCEQPFIVTPGRAQMEFDTNRGLRWVKARIANATKEPMRLKLVLPERLRGPAEVEVPPSQLKEVELTLDAEDVTAFQGDVQVTDGVLMERLSLGASPEPAQIHLVAPASRTLQFGSRNQGETGKATLVLANRGGEAAVLAIQAPPPFRVPDDEQSLSVAPGMTRQLVMEVSSEKAGRYQGKVVLSGDGNRLELEAQASFVDPNVMRLKSSSGAEAGKPVAATAGKAPPESKVARPKAVVVEAAPAGTADQPPGAPEKPQQSVGPAATPELRKNAVTALGKVNTQAAAVLSYLSVFGAPIPEEKLSKKYGKIENIQVTERGRDYLDLVWEQPSPDSPPQSYQVEGARQVFVPTTGMTFRDWQPMPEVKALPSAGAGKAGVRLTGLRPAGQYEVRVMAVDERGKVSPPSDIYMITTRPPWRMPGWAGYAGVLALLGIMLVLARRMYLKRMGLSLA